MLWCDHSNWTSKWNFWITVCKSLDFPKKVNNNNNNNNNKTKEKKKPRFLGSYLGYLFLWVKGLTPTLRQNYWPEFPKKVLMTHRANTRLETITHPWRMHKDVAFVKENWIFFFHFMNARSAYTVIKRKEDKTYLVNSASKSSSSTARS